MGVDLVEQIIEGLHSTFLKQHREPNHDKIQTIHELVATYEALVKTTRVGGKHGHLDIIMLTEEACYTLVGDTFMLPNNPGLTIMIEEVLVAAEIATQQNDHKEYLRECKENTAKNRNFRRK